MIFVASHLLKLDGFCIVYFTNRPKYFEDIASVLESIGFPGINKNYKNIYNKSLKFNALCFLNTIFTYYF